MMMRRRLAVLVATAVVMTGGIRAYWGPIHTPEPIGRCIKGGIDLNDLPFTQASFKGPIVGIASSGGGSRAAYLSAAVLREIRRAGPALLLGRSKETQQSLLDQVDAFSSVSGGSLAASYFVVNSEALERADADAAPWNDYLKRMAIEYRKRQWYGEAAINPWIWAKTIFTDYNRGVLARDDYDAVLFNGKDVTLPQLPDRPVLYLNAFDVGNSVRFVLSKHYIETQYFWPAMWGSFDVSLQPLLRENDLSYINVDPASIRVADAVYASSSFPSAYPNLAVNHCGKKIFNRGRLIFLADGVSLIIQDWSRSSPSCGPVLMKKRKGPPSSRSPSTRASTKSTRSTQNSRTGELRAVMRGSTLLSVMRSNRSLRQLSCCRTWYGNS